MPVPPPIKYKWSNSPTNAVLFLCLNKILRVFDPDERVSNIVKSTIGKGHFDFFTLFHPVDIGRHLPLFIDFDQQIERVSLDVRPRNRSVFSLFDFTIDFGSELGLNYDKVRCYPMLSPI